MKWEQAYLQPFPLPLESLEKDVRGLGGREDRIDSGTPLQVLQDRSEAGRQNSCFLALLVRKLAEASGWNFNIWSEATKAL